MPAPRDHHATADTAFPQRHSSIHDDAPADRGSSLRHSHDGGCIEPADEPQWEIPWTVTTSAPAPVIPQRLVAPLQ